MIRKRILAALFLAALMGAAWAAGGKTQNAIRPGLFELGVNLGEPTGISAKLYLDKTNAFEGIAAWAFSRGAITLSVDYLFHFHDVLKIETETFPLFVGIGAVAGISAGGGPAAAGQVSVGFRVPLGVLYVFKQAPIELSLEVVPGLNLFPDMTFLAMGGLGVRYCF